MPFTKGQADDLSRPSRHGLRVGENRLPACLWRRRVRGSTSTSIPSSPWPSIWARPSSGGPSRRSSEIPVETASAITSLVPRVRGTVLVSTEPRTIQVRGGTIHYDEPVCHCPACRRDFFPSPPELAARLAQLSRQRSLVRSSAPPSAALPSPPPRNPSPMRPRSPSAAGKWGGSPTKWAEQLRHDRDQRVEDFQDEAGDARGAGRPSAGGRVRRRWSAPDPLRRARPRSRRPRSRVARGQGRQPPDDEHPKPRPRPPSRTPSVLHQETRGRRTGPRDRRARGLGRRGRAGRRRTPGR